MARPPNLMSLRPARFGVLGLLLAAPLDGRAAPPAAAATLDPSGAYTLVLTPAEAWLSAEISVAGGETVELGATPAGAAFELEGVTTARGPIWVVVRAAVQEEEGVTWTFAVDPQLLPARQAPLEERLPPRRRGRDGRWRE